MASRVGTSAGAVPNRLLVAGDRRRGVSGWPPPLRPSAFHGLAGDLVTAVRDSTEADPAGVLGSFLVTFGAVAGPDRELWLGSRHRANEYACLVGDSGSGRKGTSLAVTHALFDLAAAGWEAILVPGLGSGEGLVGHLKRNEGSDARALVLETELGRLLRVMGREGSTASATLRNGWDGTALGRFLSRDSVLVTRHHVALLGHITPVELRELLTDVDAANGFGNRFLWFAVRRTNRIALPQSPIELVGHLVEPLRGALEFARRPGRMMFTPAARSRWIQFYAELRPQFGLTGALLGRAEAHVARLATVYALLDCCAQIDEVHLRAGEAVWAYAEASVRYIFGESTGSRDADDVRQVLEAEGGSLTKQELRQETGIRNGARLQRAIDVLVDQGVVQTRIEGGKSTGGRPATHVELR